jgi:hypothetical protein
MVFPFASLHSNVTAWLRVVINFLPLSLQPLNLHHHEEHELQGSVDANAANTVVVSFL